MHDTLKKPRELLSVSYAIRFPDLAAKSKHPGGEVDLDNMDQQVGASFLLPFLMFTSLGSGTRPPASISHRTPDSRDYLLQLYLAYAFPIRHQGR